MNEWAAKTVTLARDSDYLDKLYEVYPNEPLAREVSQSAIERVEQYYKESDFESLLNQLLDFEKFPYKDSYISFLRKDRDAIKRNPATVKRICDILYEMGINGIKEGVSQPKEANTRRGQQFRNWLYRKFKAEKIDNFKKTTNAVVLLDAKERQAKDFCTTELGLAISKRPDIVAKAGKNYIVGEAKFLTSTGGNQGRGFDDAIKLATNPSGSAFKIFILDGVLWIESGSKEFKQISYSGMTAFSSLLLEDFLNSLLTNT